MSWKTYAGYSKMTSIRSTNNWKRFGRPRNERGMALIAVTLLLVVLTVVALTAITDARFSANSVAVDETRYRARLAAEGAINEVLYQYLISPDVATRQIAAGTIGIGGLMVEVVSQNEGGLININRADADLISAMFVVSGVREPQARRLASAVLDWRDKDNLKEPGGAEASDYRSANLGVGPRNGYFETRGELVGVRGMSDELYRCIVSLITVYSMSGDIDLTVAPERVKLVLGWANANKWEGREWIADATSQTSIINPYGSSGGSTFNIVARTKGARGVPFSLRATVRVTRNGIRPFSVLEWREKFSVDTDVEEFCPDFAGSS